MYASAAQDAVEYRLRGLGPTFVEGDEACSVELTNRPRKGSFRAELLPHDGSCAESTEMKLESRIVGKVEYPFARKLLSAQRFLESIQ